MPTIHSGRLSCALVCLVALVVAGGAPSAAIAKKAKKRSACQKLAKRHKDVAPSPKLVMVVRGDSDMGEIRACVLPRGKVRKLGEWSDGLGRDSVSIADTAGTWVLLEEGWGDQYGGVSRSLTRIAVHSGGTLTLAGYGCQLSLGSASNCPDGTAYDEAGVAANGAGAVEVTDNATGATTLQAFDRAGAFSKLADGATDALRVTSTQITWTQHGMPRSAPLPS